MSADCIFCKIINHRMPAACVYEDDKAMAFLDIAPVVKGHTLVIPRTHYDPLTATPDDVLAHLIGIVRRVAQAQIHALTADGISVSQANGRCAGQVVPHIHFHVIPRFDNGDHERKWISKKYDDESEMASYARKLRAELS